MFFPSYMWMNADFHAHRLRYWYVVNALSLYDPDEDASTLAAEEAEAYSEIYSDY